jgi:carbon-monoxide dehydrogenase medium subunit
VVGNIAHGDPANDHPAAMIAMGATALLHGPTGMRTVPVDEFYTGLFMTALQENEIMVALEMKIPELGSGGAYIKLERKVGDYATAAVACQLTLDGGGTCTACRIALTNVGFSPTFAREAGDSLVGTTLDDTSVARAAGLAADAANPSPDRRGSVEYKKDLVRVLTGRTVRRAAERATA